jgi:hypothetical protein
MKRWSLNRGLALTAGITVLAAALAVAVSDKAKADTPKSAKIVATDAEKAGPDFALQGEYEGEIGGGDKIAAQVIAEGNGKFTAVILPGGLPGAGWDENTRITGSGVVKDGKITIDTEEGKGEISDGKLIGTSRSGDKV